MLSGSGERFRGDIQGLRAVAVLLALSFHLWPSAVPGGYVGVDVFFVISGFLITGRLRREIASTGDVDLVEFWARRMRRLLPAALLVLSASTAAISFFVLRSRWRKSFVEIEASAVYVQNLRLALFKAGYWNPRYRSPVQHYWSLSVEEQIYFVWPMLMAWAAAGGARWKRIGSARALSAALAAVSAASFGFCLWATRGHRVTAYYDVAARLWEFGAGGLLALAGGSERSEPPARSAAAWAGLLMVAFAAGAYSQETAFPGFAAALPVAGALAVIWAQAPPLAWSPAAALDSRPLRLIGDVSYGIYLWHLPLLVVCEEASGRSLTFQARCGIAAASVALAWLMKTFLEDPIRYGPLLAGRKPRFTFAAAAVAMAAVLTFPMIALRRLKADDERLNAADAALLARRPACLGAAAMDPAGPPCVNHALDHVVIPLPWAPGRDNVALRPVERTRHFEVLEFGAEGAETASEVAVVLNNSHEQILLAMLDGAARRKRWRGYALDPCPDVPGIAGLYRSACGGAGGDIDRWLASHPRVRIVFASSANAPPWKPAAPEEFLARWRALPPTIEHVVVLRDNPINLQPDCVERALRAGGDPRLVCFDPREDALPPDPAVAAARRFARSDVIDLSGHYCDARTCRHVIGGLRVHLDSNHLSGEFAATLEPYFLRRLDVLESKWAAEVARLPPARHGGRLGPPGAAP